MSVRSGIVATLMAVALIGCSRNEPTAHEHANAADVRVLDEGIEATGHIPLRSGVADRIEFLMLDSNGQVITLTDHFQLMLTWDPTDLATAVPIAGTTNAFDVTTTKPADTDGVLTLSVYHPHDQTTKTFTFHVLVHPPS